MRGTGLRVRRPVAPLLAGDQGLEKAGRLVGAKASGSSPEAPNPAWAGAAVLQCSGAGGWVASGLEPEEVDDLGVFAVVIDQDVQGLSVGQLELVEAELLDP